MGRYRIEYTCFLYKEKKGEMTVQGNSFRDAGRKVKEILKERYGEKYGKTCIDKFVLLSTFKEMMLEQMEDKKRRAAEYLKRKKKRKKNGK